MHWTVHGRFGKTGTLLHALFCFYFLELFCHSHSAYRYHVESQSHMVRSQTRSRVRHRSVAPGLDSKKSKMHIAKQNTFTCCKKPWTKTLPESWKKVKQVSQIKTNTFEFWVCAIMGAAHGTCKISAPGTQLIKTSPAQASSSQSWKKHFRFLGMGLKFPPVD